MYFVYIVTNRSKTLYTGVTNDLVRRVWEHRSGNGSTFTSKYKCDTLVYYERFHLIDRAIRREKVIKGWSRRKKLELIIGLNPAWRDLSVNFPGLREHD